VPRSGLEWDSEVEWRQAAAWANYTFENFQLLSGELQSAHVAAYRISQHAEAVIAHENARISRRGMARTSGK